METKTETAEPLLPVQRDAQRRIGQRVRVKRVKPPAVTGVPPPTPEEIAVDEAEIKAWWQSLTPERQEQEGAAFDRAFADMQARRGIPAEEVYAEVRAYIQELAGSPA